MSTAAENTKAKTDKMSLKFIIPLVLFYLVVGVLLILLQDQVTTIAAYVIAFVLIAFGFWFLITYFQADIEQRIAGKDLALGLILLLSGIILALSPVSLQEVLPNIWGLSLVFGGFLKIQYAFDEKSVGVKRWWIMLIFAALSLVIGLLALLRASVFGGTIGNQIIGIFMICEAVLDIVTYFLIKSGLKKMKEAEKAGALVQIPEPDPQPLPAPEQPESGEV